MREKTTGTIMANWKDHYSKLFSKQSLHMQHTLHKSELFTDAGLAKLLDSLDMKYYHINTRCAGPDGHKRRREGDTGGLSGKDLMKAVKKGDIWINVQFPERNDPRYQDLLDQMYEEFETRVEGLKTYKRGLTLLISSPNMVVPYHADVPGQMLWQIRGKKKVFVYPNTDPLLNQTSTEKLVMGEFHEVDVKYQDYFDDYATTYDLEPGYMLHWPLNFPHRVDNYDSLNVSLTTEHYTDAVRDNYVLNFANGYLRKLGFKNLQVNKYGIVKWMKYGVAAAIRYSGIGAKNRKPFTIDFSVDLNAPNCVRDIEPYDFKK
ncbi:MAG: hypothetical protein AB8B49_02485 [Nitratireductor sp.]